MKEFRFSFASEDASGLIRTDIAATMLERFARVFGGATQLLANGGYVMADGRLVVESVFVFDVATDQDAYDIYEFATMAATEIRREMGQESVYFRNVDGQVYILDGQDDLPERQRVIEWRNRA